MVPIVLARHIRDGLADYADTTFPMTNKPFKGSIRGMVDSDKDEGLTQPPFVSIKLPFRVAGPDEQFPFIECIQPKYRPYEHQMKAFRRIGAGKSTLVATGTGSGKTECFLYPILDYCYRQRRLGRRGIKAVLVYPMNALATDQAKRLAALIYENPRLRGNVTAGMYVGGQGRGDGDEYKAMAKNAIVNSHDELLKNPPDILLTNYKMLDYLLVRPKDARIWRDNEPDTLKYFVVDELHTFDGAQGTDLACLLRRLIDRLHAQKQDVCFVGTSATLGSNDSADEVRSYAKSIFNVTFDSDAIITEDRLDVREFFGDCEYDYTVPTQAQARELMDLETGTDVQEYLWTAARAWLEDAHNWSKNNEIDRLALSSSLRCSRFLSMLLEAMVNRPRCFDNELFEELREDSKFALLDRRGQEVSVDALIALVSYARTGSPQHEMPFLNVQVQLWTKELAQVQASVVPMDAHVQYVNTVELDGRNARSYLPVINCRDCGATAWIGIPGKDGRVEVLDMKAFYATYFAYLANNKFIVLQACDKESSAGDSHTAIEWFCNRCMKGETAISFDSTSQSCPECGMARIPMQVKPLELVAAGRKHYRCPFCASDHGLALVGFRATTQISVILSQLSGDAFNDDHKAIVFSDNVQDASYRASVFNSRTWRFALRNSAMDYIHSEHRENVTLADYLNGQDGYYHRRYSDEDYILRFTAPNMTWMAEYESTAAGRPAGPNRRRLMEWIGNRLRLETLQEFGLRSRVGRTLEKSGCAVIGFDESMVSAVSDVVRERCENELGLSSDAIDAEDWLHLTVGFLDDLRQKGAFFDRVYERYLSHGGVGFLLSNKSERWRPGQFAESNPSFLADKATGRRNSFDTFDAPSYRMLVQRYLSEKALVGEVEDDVAHILCEEFVKARVLTHQSYEDGRNKYTVYGIDEHSCFVDTDVVQLVCGTCGRQYSYSQRNVPAWQGGRCATKQCPGKLQVMSSDAGLSYYGKLYKNEPAPRIRAAEHTGMLNNDERAELERQFKTENPKPGDVNVLACTPTLEMGIDIGDLSTVIMASIPPRQAQYVQRAGRAGRRDGNSLVLAVANAKPHDMYFYKRPHDMINGDVEPPAVFLEATAVLDRQLTAYALDRWVHEQLGKGALPKDIVPAHVGDCLRNIDEQQSKGFPTSFLTYAKNESTMLLNGFETLFSFDEDTKDELSLFMNAGEHSMAVRVLDTFEKTSTTLDECKQQIKELMATLYELKKKPDDPSFEQESEECKAEINSLKKMTDGIKRRSTFEYFSDEGILPNYAFPESGVTLRTILKPDKTDTDEVSTGDKVKPSRRRNETGEFTRPASSAIIELAPGNTFYTHGHKYKINKILLSKTDKDDGAVWWRLCPNCSHAEPLSQVENTASCPSCGSLQWADNGQKRSMIQIDTVIAEEKYSESIVDDSNDRRASTPFVKNTLVDVGDNDIESAWRLKGDVDFGFEYIPQGTVREINFGEAGTNGPEVEVAGDKQVRKGFEICSKCGALADEHGRMSHSYACPARKGAMQDISTSQCLFLYREVKTEILRMLVPGIVDMSGDNRSAESFTAAVMLGMREQFGNVDHLNVTLSNEPLKDGSGLRKTYLVLYDTIPGGTGYLKEFARNQKRLLDILSRAFQIMQDCDCEDGCYKCLYAYRQSRDLTQISKQLAMDMIGPIVNDDSGQFERINSVSTIPVNKLFDSTLEQQFIEALGRLRSNPLASNDKGKGIRADCRTDFINGKKGYALTINGQNWEIEPQMDSSEDSSISVPSKPDFIIRPVAEVSLGDDGNTTEDLRKPVAIFTDGLRYHAGIVGADTAKREALRRAGYRVWTLTYDDVAGFLNEISDTKLADPVLDVNNMPSREAYRRWVNGHDASMLDPGRVSTMGILGFYLSCPYAERILSLQAQALSYAMFSKPGSTSSTKISNKDIREAIVAMHSALHNQDIPASSDALGEYAKVASYTYGSSRIHGYGGMGVDTSSGTPIVTTDVCILFDDTLPKSVKSPIDNIESREENPLLTMDNEQRLKFKQEWSGFWHLINIMQFSGSFSFATTTALDNRELYAPLRQNELETETAGQLTGGWDNIINDPTYTYLDDSTKQAIANFETIGISAPQALGYELFEHDEVIGQADLAWEDMHIVYISSDMQNDVDGDAQSFASHGWQVIGEDAQQAAKIFETAGRER